MSVLVGELQSTLARTTDCDWSAIGPPIHFFGPGQKRDYLSRASQCARGATKNNCKIQLISNFVCELKNAAVMQMAITVFL